MATPVGTPQLVEAEGGRTDGVYTSTVTWQLQIEISSNLLDMLPEAAAAAHAAYLPFAGNTHPLVPLASCRGITCKKLSGVKQNGLYHYTAKYSDANADPDKKATDDDPLLDLPVYKPIAGMTSRAITQDRDKKAILNSAGDPILQTMDDNTIGLKVSANFAVIPTEFLGYRNTCNDAPISVGGLPVGTNMARFILPSDWFSERKNRNDIWYYTCSFELMFDERDSHYGYPLNAGFRELEFDDDFKKIPVNITGDDGSEPSDPVPLDEQGFVLEDPEPDTVLFRETKKYHEANYADLPGVS